MQIKRKDLEGLPRRKWNETSIYHEILVVNTRQKHDSGYALMSIIGCDDNCKPLEIAACCDDLELDCSAMLNMDSYYAKHGLRNDMYYPSGIIRYWSRGFKFQVGTSLSSTTVTLIVREKCEIMRELPF